MRCGASFSRRLGSAAGPPYTPTAPLYAHVEVICRIDIAEFAWYIQVADGTASLPRLEEKTRFDDMQADNEPLSCGPEVRDKAPVVEHRKERG